jgi:glycosyltransferase involved in cell wall biosynthesis
MRWFGQNKECLILSTKPANDMGYFDKMQTLAKITNAPVQWVSDFLPEERIVEALSTCDLIFLPYSEYGGIGVSAAIRTCLKAGVPIISFNQSFFKDIVKDHELIGFIGKPDEPFPIWASRLSQFIEQYSKPEVKEQTQKKFIEERDLFVNEYSWENIAKMHLNHYFKLLTRQS